MHGHTPVALHHAAVGCENRTAGAFCLSSCHNSPLVRHFTHGSLLCENCSDSVWLSYPIIIHKFQKNASAFYTPLAPELASTRALGSLTSQCGHALLGIQ